MAGVVGGEFLVHDSLFYAFFNLLPSLPSPSGDGWRGPLSALPSPFWKCIIPTGFIAPSPTSSCPHPFHISWQIDWLTRNWQRVAWRRDKDYRWHRWRSGKNGRHSRYALLLSHPSILLFHFNSLILIPTPTPTPWLATEVLTNFIQWAASRTHWAELVSPLNPQTREKKGHPLLCGKADVIWSSLACSPRIRRHGSRCDQGRRRRRERNHWFRCGVSGRQGPDGSEPARAEQWCEVRQ